VDRRGGGGADRRRVRVAARGADGDAGLSQHVAGLGITLLATSLASFAYRVSFPQGRQPADHPALRADGWLPLPVLDAQTPLTLLALLLVPLVAWG
jgi:ABC-type uncharacterized transport system permease subunit